MSCQHACMCTTHVSCPWKGVSDVLKLELQMVVSHHVSAGNPLDGLPGALYH